MRSVSDSNRELAQQIYIFLLEKATKTQLGVMFYIEVCTIFAKVQDFF